MLLTKLKSLQVPKKTYLNILQVTQKGQDLYYNSAQVHIFLRNLT